MDYFDPYAGMSFFGPDTSGLDAMLAANGGFYGDTSGLDAMLAANGGFYGPDTSWLDAEMAANFDPTNPYLFDAITSTNDYASSVYDNTNAAWSDYIRG